MYLTLMGCLPRLNTEWNTYIQAHDVYGNTQPLKTLLRLIRQKELNRIFVCSQVAQGEKQGKIRFVTDDYDTLENHIYFVGHSLEKLDCLEEIHQARFPQLRQE